MTAGARLSSPPTRRARARLGLAVRHRRVRLRHAWAKDGIPGLFKAARTPGPPRSRRLCLHREPPEP
jgi:hypothetical protein